MNKYWISWVHMGHFSLRFPWWSSGHISYGIAVHAAIQAKDESHAKKIIMDAYKLKPDKIEWLSCKKMKRNWSPFSDMRPRLSWMKWDDIKISENTRPARAGIAAAKAEIEKVHLFFLNDNALQYLNAFTKTLNVELERRKKEWVPKKKKSKK